MPKFYGAIGFAEQTETKPGVWKSQIVSRNYFFDLVRNNMRIQGSDKVNDDINISNQISVIIDPYVYENFRWIKYVEFMGAKWKVTDVEILYPRLQLTLGGLYND